MGPDRQPLAIDLFCGLGGWTAGLLAEGYYVIGFDIERHVYGEERYPGHLVLQDVLSLHGSQFKDAALIVASPPCQEYSYMAMPWSKAKAKAAKIRADETGAEMERLTALFRACFRIQREASEAAGRHIPMVVENVKGAQPWVGRAHWAFGSYFLWGDIPALMPIKKYHERQKVKAGEQWNVNRPNFTGTRGWDEGLKAPGGPHIRNGAPLTERLTNPAEHRDADSYDDAYEPLEGRKGAGYAWFKKGTGAWARDPVSASGSHGSKSRKAASAKIAKIPFALSSHIARVYRPTPAAEAA